MLSRRDVEKHQKEVMPLGERNWKLASQKKGISFL